MDTSKMGGKVAQYNTIKGKLTPIKDNLIVEDMNFGERKTKGGIILMDDDGKEEGIRPRWARVYAKGPLNKDDYQVGDWVLVAHGRWSRGLDVEDPETGEVVKLRRADPDEILGVSDTQPTEAQMSHSVEQLYGKIQALQTKGLELHRERYKVQGTYDKAQCQIILDDIRQFAREIERGLVDFDVDFGKTSKK